MVIKHCPNPSLAFPFQLKAPEQLRFLSVGACQFTVLCWGTSSSFRSFIQKTGVQEVAAMFDKVMSVCVMLLLLTTIGLAVFSCPRDSVTSSLQNFLHAESIILGNIQHMQTV